MIFTFLKIPLEFLIFYLPLQIPDKTKLHSWQFHEILLDTLEIPHYLVTLFLGHYFFVTPPPSPPRNFMSPIPLFVFSGIAQSIA